MLRVDSWDVQHRVKYRAKGLPDANQQCLEYCLKIGDDDNDAVMEIVLNYPINVCVRDRPAE